MSPISFNVFRSTPTVLELNGPILSFSEPPVNTTTNSGTSVSLIGIATVSFGGTSILPPNLGEIEYRWYEVGVGALSDDENISGSGTTTLTLSNVVSPTDNGRTFFLRTDYDPSSTTGEAIAEPFDSDNVVLTVRPFIDITTQPTNTNGVVDNSVTFSVISKISDESFGSGLSYQWQIDGVDVVDGTKDIISFEGEIEQYLTSDSKINLPINSKNIKLRVGGSVGGSGGDDVSGIGGTGGFGRVGLFDYDISGGRELEFIVGNRGNDGLPGNDRSFGLGGSSGVGTGGIGGGAGNIGWSGGGAGGGGATGIKINSVLSLLSGGGAGGGGAVLGDNGEIGGNATSFSNSETINFIKGEDGKEMIGDGAGGGGGGAGASSTTERISGTGDGGSASNSTTVGASGGTGGSSLYKNDYLTLTGEDTNPGDGYVILTYQNDDFIPVITLVDESNGSTSSFLLTEADEFSNYQTNRIYNLTVNSPAYVNFNLRGAGGGSAGGNIGGQGGSVSGVVGLVTNTNYKLVMGGAGGDDGTGGYNGGGTSLDGSAAGGGGYTGLFINSISEENALLIAGGGGGANVNGNGGSGGGEEGETGTGVGAGSGGSQSNGYADLQGEYLNSAGGGGGYYGGFGGQNASASGGGGSGYGNLDEDESYSFDFISVSGGGAGEDGFIQITNPIATDDIARTLTISGSNTPNLTISSNEVGFHTVRCVITNPDASNTPLNSDDTSFVVVTNKEEFILNIETIGNTDQAFLSTVNLINGGLELNTTNSNTSTGELANYYSFHSPNKDFEVVIDMFGGKGADNGSYVGGEGGYSRFKFDLSNKTEYVVTGLSSLVNTPFLYRKASLIAAVGQGGSAGSAGNGGSGGGINISGLSGSGRLPGKGGQSVTNELPENGIFGSYFSNANVVPPDTIATGVLGGRTIPSSRGVFYRDQGFGPSDDIGQVKFRLSDGTIVNNTSVIERGFKSGYSIMETSGNGVDNGGLGGNGAVGGDGGTNNSGGGGGAGYSDKSVSVLTSSSGGNTTTNAKIIVYAEAATDFGDVYVDSSGRILIFANVTPVRDPRTIPLTNGIVLPGTDSAIDDARWNFFLERAVAESGWRLAPTLDSSDRQLTAAVSNNLRNMINANRTPIRRSLTDWIDNPNRGENFLHLAWDENSGFSGTGLDYSILSWVKERKAYGWYGYSSRKFFKKTTYNYPTANLWLLPPGVPDF